MKTAEDSIAAKNRATHPLDAMAKAPKHHELLLENDNVRVLDTRLSPGDRTPVHAHEWPAALYVLSWSDFVRYDPDGNVLVDSRTMDSKPANWRRALGRPDRSALRSERRTN